MPRRDTGPDRAETLEGRVCLVTGTTGIAAATAELLAARGADVVVAGRDAASASDLVARLDGASSVGDLTDPAAARAAVAACTRRFGRLDAVFHVAGGSGRRFGDGPVDQATLEGWQATLALNATTAFNVCAAATAAMLSQPRDDDGARGAVLLCSSVLASSPSPRHFATHAYAASKGAVAAMALAMASRYAPDGIRVNVLSPGLTRTPMTERAEADPEAMRYARGKQPLADGLIDASDVAAAATFLLGPGSRFVTGQNLAVDAGWSMSEGAPNADRRD